LILLVVPEPQTILRRGAPVRVITHGRVHCLWAIAPTTITHEISTKVSPWTLRIIVSVKCLSHHTHVLTHLLAAESGQITVRPSASNDRIRILKGFLGVFLM